jgi:hypothetical protein
MQVALGYLDQLIIIININAVFSCIVWAILKSASRNAYGATKATPDVYASSICTPAT